MDRQEPSMSSRPVMQSAFTSTGFSSNFSGMNTPAGNVSNPLIMSLQHLQGFTNAAGTSNLLPAPSSLALNGQFAPELNNIATMSWPSRNAGSMWLGQAAAMLPMYGVLSTNNINNIKSADFANLEMHSQAPSTSANCFPNNIPSCAPTSAPASLYNPGIFPLNPCGFVHSSQDVVPQSPTQVIQHHTSLRSSLHSSSPANTFVTVEQQPNSISSHCSVEMRPGSGASSHELNVGGIHSNDGSNEALQQPCCASTSSELLSIDHMSMADMADRNLYANAQSMDGFSNLTQVSNAPSTSLSCDPQQIAYDLSATGHDGLNYRDQNSEVIPATSSELVHDFITPQEHLSASSPPSPHDNALDATNLEDLNWLAMDFFGHASADEKDAMQSVLNMDASAIQRMFPSDLPISNSVNEISKVQNIDPKTLDAPKSFRENESEDIEEELSKFLSLMVKNEKLPKNKSDQPLLSCDVSCSPLFGFRFDASEDKKISLNPVTFTPPDSPEVPSISSSRPVSSNFFVPPSSSAEGSALSKPKVVNTPESPKRCPSLSPFVFFPPMEKKITKVPVYKQKMRTVQSTELKKDENMDDGDAYDFTVDDDDDKPLPVAAMISDSQIREQKLEAEVAQKLAKINSVHSELRGKSYDSQNQQDLWRHVVPKKRHTSAMERPSVPSTPLLPPTSLPDQQKVDLGLAANRTFPNDENMSIAEKMQRRQQHRSSYGFLRTTCLDDTETAADVLPKESSPFMGKIQSTGSSKTETCSQPRLPKLLIRLPKPSVGSVKEEKTRTHKRKRKKDLEWFESEKERRKKKSKRKHKKPKIEYESYLISADDNPSENAHDEYPGQSSSNYNDEKAVYSRKRRLMMQWNNCRENSLENGENGVRTKRISLSDRIHCPLPENTERHHTIKFHPASSKLPKGSFVVNKKEIFKNDCPLWKIDNQTLLQKYLPYEREGGIAYKSSSTYSGWCSVTAEDYLVVQVRSMHHSRVESVVEPEIPLLDMFPAISSVTSENFAAMDSDECGSRLRECDKFLKEPTRDLLATYVRAMLNHSLQLDFFQSIKQRNDWNYLRALNDIDRINKEKKEKILSRVKWHQRYMDMVHFYSCCSVCDTERRLVCQSCATKEVEKIAQLFSNEGYDYDTLQSEEMQLNGGGSPMPDMEFFICSSCATSTAIYHRLHHMRYILLKQCEEMMERTSSENQNMSAESVIDVSMKNIKWLYPIINEYIELWRRVEINDF